MLSAKKLSIWEGKTVGSKYFNKAPGTKVGFSGNVINKAIPTAIIINEKPKMIIKRVRDSTENALLLIIVAISAI